MSAKPVAIGGFFFFRFRKANCYEPDLAEKPTSADCAKYADNPDCGEQQDRGDLEKFKMAVHS
jgi:hypothetical protein